MDLPQIGALGELEQVLASFLRKNERVLLCFPGPWEPVGQTAAEYVKRAGGVPVFWGGDLLWKSLLWNGFRHRCATVIGAPDILLGLSKLSRRAATPLYIRNAVVLGDAPDDWLRSSICDGLDCKIRGWIPGAGHAAQPDSKVRELLRELGIQDHQQVVGISVRNLRDNDHFPEQFARLCDRLSLEQGKTIVFLVMQESRDEAISREIMAKMSAPSYLAKTPGDPGAMLSLIRDMDAVVSMRLHTIIFAAQMQVPVVGCVYDPKVSAFLDMLQMPSCGTPGEMDADQAFRVTTDLLRDRDAVCDRLSHIVSDLTHQAETTTELFAQLLRKQGLM